MPVVRIADDCNARFHATAYQCVRAFDTRGCRNEGPLADIDNAAASDPVVALRGLGYQ